MDVHGFSQSSYFLQRIFHDDFLTKASSVEISPVSFFLGLVSMLRRIHDSFHQFVVLITIDLSSGISLKCPQAGNFRKGARSTWLFRC